MKTRIIRLINDLPIDDGRQQPGVICLANEARFTASHYSEALTAYTVGYRDPEDLQGAVDTMFPMVSAARRFEFKSMDNAADFASETDDVRAIGASFKRVETKGSSVNEKTLNKGLTMRLDKDEMMDGDEERAAGSLKQRLLRNELRRGLVLVVAAATNTNKTWNSVSDPDHDVIADLLTGGDARGFGADLAVYGETAWQKRSLAFRAQNNAGGFASASLTPESLAGLLGVRKVYVSRARYQSTATAKSKIVGAYVLMYAAAQGVGKDDPSNVKRFVTMTDAGPMRVYREEMDKFVDITVEHYSNIVITSTLGVRMFTIQ